MDQSQRSYFGNGYLDHCISGHDHRLWHRGWVGQGCDQCRRMDQGQNGWRQEMKGFILGTIFGIVICTVGFGGIARMLDTGVNKVQEISKEAAK
jgi:hypothetical protein